MENSQALANVKSKLLQDTDAVASSPLVAPQYLYSFTPFSSSSQSLLSFSILWISSSPLSTSLSAPVPIMNQNLVSDRFPRVGIWLAQLPFSAPGQLTNEDRLGEVHMPESISYDWGGSGIWGLPIKGCGWRKIL